MGKFFSKPITPAQVKAREDKARSTEQDLIAAYLLEQIQSAAERGTEQDLINAYLLEKVTEVVNND